jgi:hypothetical protein
MTRLHHRRFLALLIALLFLVVVYPIIHDSIETRLVYDISVTLVFLAAIRSLFAERAGRIAAIVLGLPTLVASWIDSAHERIPNPSVALAFHIAAVVFDVFMIASILRIIHRERRVTADGVYGAFCGYLLIGMAFSQIYCMIELLRPESFQGNLGSTNYERRHALVYFSYITLATVGYGDIAPVSGPARGIAVTEALVGQFYIAAFVAELIGKRVAQVLSERMEPHASPSQQSSSDSVN